ncbi:alginate export family protein [bacterium]|nr:alginate export family protein [bacterium]
MKEKKWLLIGGLYLTLFLWIGVGSGLGKVELGGEIRIRSTGVNNSDYDDEIADYSAFSTQRTRVHFRGDLAKNVLFDLGVQSNGYWGGSSFSGVGDDYGEEKEFLNSGTLYLENAYLKFIQVEKKPIDVFVGRQPICYGDGLVLDDSNYGFDALRAIWRLPGNLEWEALTIKGRESSKLIRKENGDAGAELESWKYVAEDKDADVYGTVFRWLPIRRKIEAYFIYEVDKATDTLTFKDKYFYGLRLEEKMKEGIDYRIEFIMKQSDKLKGAFDYDGCALHAGIVGYAHTRILGAVNAKVEYFQSTGSGDKQDEKNFDPAYARTSNNFGEYYFGEYYSEVSSEMSNKKITNFGVSISPLKKTNISLNYYIFNSWSKTISGARDIGEELDAVLFYRYSPQVKLRLVYAVFLPGEASVSEGTSASKILGEILVCF